MQENPNDGLSRLFATYRQMMPDPQGSANFMPGVWAKIDQRRASTNWFGRFAKGLVAAAVAAYVILAMISATPADQGFLNGTYVDALVTEHNSKLEPFHLDRVAQVSTDLDSEHQIMEIE